MNISYNWLKELIDLDLSPEETAAALTRVGLAVEGIHQHGDDFVLDIDLTSNRPDCLSHRGVCRELGAITSKPYGVERHIIGQVDTSADAVPFPSVLAPEIVRIDAPDLCHRFTARIIRGVTIGPSPKWLAARLEAIGERTINNVADITNYVMHELGQPMHAFDLDKLTDGRIIVRRARDGEKIRTLDEIDRTLDSSMLAICDAQKPVAVAGIMGGFESAICNQTTNVFLEVAYFNRESIRGTSRKLNLTTEASYRFERGVDIENLHRASDRAASLICELAGGIASDIIDVYPTQPEQIKVRAASLSNAVTRLTGLSVADERCKNILAALGIFGGECPGDGAQSGLFVAPTWRHDIAIEADLVEEVARHAGYENIAVELPPAFEAGAYQPSEPRKKSIRNSLVGLGFDEAVSYSFIETEFDEMFEPVPDFLNEGLAERYVTLRDSVIEGAVRMRPTLVPGLLSAVRHNFNQQRKNLRLFEIGKAFAAMGEKGSLPDEREILSLVLTGGEMESGRAKPTRALDFYDAKGAVEAAFGAVGCLADFIPEEIKHLQKGQSAAIYSGTRRIGSVGKIKREIADYYKFKQPVYVAEIDLQAVFENAGAQSAYHPLSKFPGVVRDLTLSVNRSVSFADIRKTVLKAGSDFCTDMAYVGVYVDEAAEDISLTVRLEYRRDDRTLVEEEVEAVHARIIASLEKNLNIRQKM